MLVSALRRMISPQYSEGAARCRAARWSGLVAIPPARDCEPGHRRKAVAMAAGSVPLRLHVEERISRRRSPGRKGMAPGLQKRLEEVSLTAA